ncbi:MULTISPECIES: hypothetical protein [Shewanella]|uniref:hypothetical protein n=1 Tax=Shewanella TaxID=22 RepID=UPI00057A864F|nr:hypothetical protein [Shewanella sp. ECSMB14102]
MKVLIRIFLYIFVGVVIGYFLFYKENVEPVGKQYGVLRIPMLSGCPLKPDGLHVEGVVKVEAVDFNLKVDGVFSSGFWKVYHTGTPVEALRGVYGYIGECIPSMSSEYLGEGVFEKDLSRYFAMSNEFDVYVHIDGGKAKVIYFKE